MSTSTSTSRGTGKAENSFRICSSCYTGVAKPGYPDCIGRRFVGKGWERVAIEFEYKSSNFKQHKHDPKGCDIIVCWENDWKDCPLEIIELKTEIQGMENYNVSRPETEGLSDKNLTLENLFGNTNSNDHVKKWYTQIFEKLIEYNADIWAKFGKQYTGWYSPARSFVSVKPSSKSIKFECYSGGSTIDGAIITNKRFAPNWSKFYVKDDSDIEKAVKILIESHKRIENALATGKATGYFSDGEQFGTPKEIMDGEDDNE
jgi:hypothetical protein